MKRRTGLVFATLFLLSVPLIQADVAVNTLFTNSMVLQQDKVVPVWGTAETGENVTVEFAGQKVSTMATDGRWRVDLQPLKTNAQPAVLTITGKNTLTINDVLVGEVWVCSGQSNMERQLGNTVENWKQEVADANFPLIRAFKVPRLSSPQPTTDPKGEWIVCSPQTVSKMTAVGYFFARDLQQKLNVPIGILYTTWGGTPAEVWTPVDAMAGTPELEKMGKNKKAGTLYNAMVVPLQPYAIRGITWYQGESNSGRGKAYRDLFPALITSWRKAWGEGDISFLFVQIAPFADPKKPENDPAVREAQLLTLQKVPNTAMVVTADVGDPTNIHPARKQPVGERLALAARALAYGEKIEYSGPLFSAMRVEGNRAILSFTHVGGGLVAKDGDLKGFVIAGADYQFVPAKAEIQGAEIIVSDSQVASPVAVRYGWAKAPDINLFNADGLPASPFRTDTEAAEETSQVENQNPLTPTPTIPETNATPETPVTSTPNNLPPITDGNSK